MDKQEYRELLDGIKKGYNAGNYEQVAAYADELDFGRIREPRILEMISDSYDHLGETDNAIDALVAAFARNKTSKQTAHTLCRLCIKAGDLDGAVGYYEAYRKLSNNNSKALLLKYEIGRAGGVPVNELIKVLEAYNSRERDEKWEYELARLYHEAGQVQNCVDTCDDICLWYSEGEYVKKALELKFSHTALTQEQQIRYERMMQEFLDPDEMTEEPEEEVDEVAMQLADEYFAEDAKAASDSAAEDQLQETMVLPIKDIIGEIEHTENTEQEEAEEGSPEQAGTVIEEETPVEAEEAAAEEVSPEPEKPSNKITFEELRAMIHNGNSKKAQSGVFFTYSEPTEEDIAEEEAEKAARAEARRRAAEEAARKAAEEAAAREAAAAAAREAARLEEEARAEAALRIAEEAMEVLKEDEDTSEGLLSETETQDPDMEIDETKFINRREVLARLEKEDEEAEAEETETAVPEDMTVDAETPAGDAADASSEESLGFTAMINMIAAEVDLEDVTAAPAVPETKEDDEVGATQIFSRAEMDSILSEPEEKKTYQTPQEKLGAAIEQIIDDANMTVERDMEETKNIRIVLPVASASKLGMTSVKLSQYASSVEKPELETDTVSRDQSSFAGAPRIIDNVDFSYIPISSDEDGQLGLNIEYLTFNDDDDVEGQLSIADIMEHYSRKLKKNSAKVLDIESERLRQIQEAVNLTAPVKLPYSMDDLMFDDIEISDINGNVEEAEGDVFQFDPESIGIIPSDEELLAAAEAEEAAAEAGTEVPEETAGEAAEEEVPGEEAAGEELAEEAADTEEETAEEAEEPEAENAGEEDPVEASITALAGALAAAAAAESVHIEPAQEEIIETEEPAEEEPVEAEKFTETVVEAVEAEEPAGEEEAVEEEPVEEEEAVEAEEIVEAEEAVEEEIAEAEETVEEEIAETEDIAEEETAEAEEPVEETADEAEPEMVAMDADVIADVIAGVAAASMVPDEEETVEADETETEEAEAEEAETDETETEESEAEEAETEELPEEEPAGPEAGGLSEAERAIAAFESNSFSENSSETDSAIEDELFDVMAELDKSEFESAQNDAETEKLLENDTFEEMFESLMADDAEPVPEGADSDYAEYDNEEQRTADTEEALEVPAAEDAEAEAGEADEYDEPEEAEELPEEKPAAVAANGYMLPDDMRESMSEFLLIDGMEQQIVDVIGDIIDRKKAGDMPAGNLIVTGDIKSGKTFLAIEMIKAITEEMGSKNGKVAKVQAELLNGKNIEKVFEKIGGSDLIIENVGYLDDRTIEDLTRVISGGRFDSMVIIEGNSLAVESTFSSFPEFSELFENRIDINELSIVQWAEVAMQYADEKGFVLDDMAKLALHARINEINVPTARLGYHEVLDIMDDAIARAEKRNSGKLFAAFKKTEDDKLEILESDFM